MPHGRGKKKDKVGAPLRQLLKKLERKGKNQPWHCTECNVLNAGDHCVNCGRNHFGRPDGKIPDEKPMRAQLNEKASEGFTSYEP